LERSVSEETGGMCKLVLTLRRSDGLGESVRFFDTTIRVHVNEGCLIFSEVRKDGSEEVFIFPLANLLEASMTEIMQKTT
jgi:hypothetical protein